MDADPSLTKGLFDFQNPIGKNLLDRGEDFRAWVDDASSKGLFQFLRHHTQAPHTVAEVVGWGGHVYSGVNFGSQDYLALSRHPAVVSAAVDACTKYGTHSAGSEPMGGGLAEARALERDLAAYLRQDHVVLFPTGWGAGYGSIKGLIRPHDHILVDALAHDCLQHGARASTGNVTYFAHNDVVSLEKRLARARQNAPDAAVLVITESLFSMDSDHPDFSAVVALCRKYDAALMVDVAHDLGLLGPGGRGVLEEQGVLDEVDFIVGSFSKTFACIGGFFASNSKSASYFVRGFSGSYTFSNFLTPPQVASVRAALHLVQSEEGARLRAATLLNADLMRSALKTLGVEVLGRLSSMVLPIIGPEPEARLAYRRCLDEGVVLNNIEFPACRRGQARFRLQVTPLHDNQQIERAATVVAEAIEYARAQWRGGREEARAVVAT